MDFLLLDLEPFLLFLDLWVYLADDNDEDDEEDDDDEEEDDDGSALVLDNLSPLLSTMTGLDARYAFKVFLAFFFFGLTRYFFGVPLSFLFFVRDKHVVSDARDFTCNPVL